MTTVVARAIAPVALTEFARGDRHPDADGNTIAGIPQDPSCLIGPAILACARTPVKDPSDMPKSGPISGVTNPTCRGPDVQFIPITFPGDRGMIRTIDAFDGVEHTSN